MVMVWLRRTLIIGAAVAAVLHADLASPFYAMQRGMVSGECREAAHAQGRVPAPDRAALLHARVDAVTRQIATARAGLVEVILSIQRTKTALTQTNAQLAHQPRALSLRMQKPNHLSRSLIETRTALVTRIQTLDSDRRQALATLSSQNAELTQARRELAAAQLGTSHRAGTPVLGASSGSPASSCRR
jgi:hypothetical protein